MSTKNFEDYVVNWFLRKYFIFVAKAEVKDLG